MIRFEATNKPLSPPDRETNPEKRGPWLKDQSVKSDSEAELTE